jgi:WD40 repeat protein
LEAVVRNTEVTGLAFSNNGQRLAVAIFDTVTVWDVAHDDGALIKTFTAPDTESDDDRSIASVAFLSDDGSEVAMMNDAGTVSVRRVDGKASTETNVPTDSQMLYMAPIPQTTQMVLGDAEGRAWLMPIRTAPPKRVPLKQHRNWINSVAASHDGTRFATASDDKLAIVWDVQSTTPLLTLRHSVAVNHVAFAPSDDRVLTAGHDDRDHGFMRVWSVPKPEHIVEAAYQRLTRALTVPECERYEVAKDGQCLPQLSSLELQPLKR